MTKANYTVSTPVLRQSINSADFPVRVRPQWRNKRGKVAKKTSMVKIEAGHSVETSAENSSEGGKDEDRVGTFEAGHTRVEQIKPTR